MGSASESNAVGQLAPMLASQGAGWNAVNAAIAASPPILYNPDLNDYNQLVNSYSLMNAAQSKQAERAINPYTAQSRDLQQQDMANTYQSALSGDVPVGVQNSLMRAGLIQQGATGGPTGPGTRGNATLTQIYGSGANDYVNQVRNMVGNYLNLNPLPTAGLDPSAAASMRYAANTGGANLQNNWMQQLLQGQANAQGNLANSANAMAGAAASEGASNAAGHNAARAAEISALAQMASAAAGGAGMAMGGKCWVAREVYGVENPKWIQFRTWMLTDSPRWFRNLYLSRGERFAGWIKNKPVLKRIIRLLMDRAIA